MQNEELIVTRNFYDPTTGHTVQRECPLHEWTPGTLAEYPGTFYPTEFINEKSSDFGTIDGISIPEDSIVVTPYVSAIWYDDEFPRVFGKCCVLPQTLVHMNTKVDFWNLFGDYYIDFRLQDGTYISRQAKTMLGYSKVYMKTSGKQYRHIHTGIAEVRMEYVQVLFEIQSNRFYENVLGV